MNNEKICPKPSQKAINEGTVKKGGVNVPPKTLPPPPPTGQGGKK